VKKLCLGVSGKSSWVRPSRDQIVYAHISNPVKGTVIVVDVKNKRIYRSKVQKKRAMRVSAFPGKVYGFRDAFLKEIRNIDPKS